MMENITYEHFMRRGFKCDRGKRKGADVDYYSDLAYKSFEHVSNPQNQKLKNDFDKSLLEVKGYMAAALTHSLKRLRGNIDGITAIQRLIAQTRIANSKVDLDTVVENGITVFNTYNINF